jgi:hypothetical protein
LKLNHYLARMRTVAFWVSVAFLLFFGVSGLQSFFNDWGLASSLGQKFCGIGQATFGTCGLLAGVGAILKRRWAGSAALAFAVAGGITAALASVAWGETNLATGVASGAFGFLIGLLLYWGIDGRVAPPNSV